MKGAMFALACLGVVSACAPIQRAQVQQQRAAIDAEAATCVQKLKSGEFKTHVEAASCVNDAYQRGIAEGLYPFPDIRLAWEAARLRVAEQLDRGEITETEARARLLEIGANATAEARRRSIENAETRAEINTMNALSTGVYMNMIGQGVGMMQGH